MDAIRVMARRSFAYGTEKIVVGQVFLLTGESNDRALLESHTAGRVVGDISTVVCTDCQRELGAGYIKVHQHTMHSAAAVAELQREADGIKAQEQLRKAYSHARICGECQRPYEATSGPGALPKPEPAHA